ncbi:MAG: RNA methyltransferase [Rhodobacter sp.]|nr:RNA methyltransferase [Rhodobacter sp.]MCY4169449.1 RNA methyltransferase [Rhodobacter sp.]
MSAPNSVEEAEIQPCFVLIRPQLGENIGAAARAMANFGLSRMRLVAPRDVWPNQSAVAMASGAGRILDNTEIFGSTEDAVADRTTVYATTARHRDLANRILTPESAMCEAAGKLAAGERIAVLFGPERAGLENDDIARANAIVRVPTDPGFSSINLAQCVLLIAYEWRRQSEEIRPEGAEPLGTGLASGIEVEKLAEHYETRLEETGFFFPENKADRMKRVLRNLWSRMPLTHADVRLFHGILRQMVRGKTRG